MGGKASSAMIIEDVDLALKVLEIVYCANGTTAEAIEDRNGHRRKEYGEGKSVSWGGALTKGEVHECELTKNMFFYNDLLQFFLKKNKITLSYSLTPLFL